jgi:hypothetical protein
MWPRHSYFEEDEDPPRSKAMLTDQAWDSHDYPSPHPYEYEFYLGMKRVDFTLAYEIGNRAFVWSVRETRDHQWDFVVSW